MSLLRRSSEVAIDSPHDASAQTKTRRAATATEHERDVIEVWLRRAFTIAAESDPTVRAVYLRLHRNTLIPLLEIDRSHRRIGRTVALSDCPPEIQNLETGEPCIVAVAESQLGPQTREIVARTGVVTAINLPVLKDSEVHGVLVIGMRKPEISKEVFQALVTIKGSLEHALSNLPPR